MGKQARRKQTRKKEKSQQKEKLSHMTEPWQRLYELIQKKVQ
ncbi:hypothetical protein [Pueribacillus theae]|nr:hypothetical protein [Pueribacillus theae]